MTDPRIRRLAEARQRVGHRPYGSTANWNNLAPDEQGLFLSEAAVWLDAAIEAGIAPLAESPTAPAAAEQSEACGKCKQPFDPADTRFDGHARFYLTPYCRGCVDRCHDNESADHRCVICA